MARWLLLPLLVAVALASEARTSDAGISPTFVSYTSPGEITLTAPSADVSSIYSVDYVDLPPRYQFSDTVHPVSAGSGCTAVDADTVDCAVGGTVTMTANLLAGDDTIWWSSGVAGDALTVDGGDGNDQMYVINLGGVLYNGDEGFDTLNVHDPFFADGTEGIPPEVSYDLNPGDIKRAALDDIQFDSSTEDVNIEVDQDAQNFVNVHGTASTTDTFVNLSGPANEFLVAPGFAELDTVQGPVQVNASADDIAALFDLAHEPAAYSVSGGGISRATGTFGGLSYSGFGQVSLYGPNAGGVFSVSGSSSPLSLFGASGGDSFNIAMGFLDGVVTVEPGDGADNVFIDDAASVAGHTYVINASPVHLSRAGSAGVSWNNLETETVTFEASNGSDQVALNAWYPEMFIHANDGNDTINVTATGALDRDAEVEGGAGNDALVVDDTASATGASYEIGAETFRRDGTDVVSHFTTETITFQGGQGSDTVVIDDTIAGYTYQLFGNDGDDSFAVGQNLSDLGAPISIDGGVGGDAVFLNDSAGPPSGIYEVRGGSRIERFPFPPVLFSNMVTSQLTTTAGSDTVRILSTSSGTTFSLFAGGGPDEAQVFAAGLAVVGSTSLEGGSETDEIQLYTGGLGSTFVGVNSIVTPGRQTVLHNFELRLTSSTAVDADGDGCTDLQELGDEAEFGGLRDPSDAFDFFDVVGPTPPRDRAVDLNDALAVLGKFGLLPGDPGYDVLFDRMAGPELQPWRSRQASGVALGIDLSDALVSLQQFGHSCAP